jgi:hypothetical protein
MLESRPKNARFQFTLVRLLLAVAVFAAILGGMKPLGQASMPFAVLIPDGVRLTLCTIRLAIRRA